MLAILFTGKAPWTVIGEVVEAVRIPVTGNGDVRSTAEARRMADETGCASVMIGRGALGSPWIFDESFDALGAEAQRDHKDRIIIRRHMALIQEHCFDRYALSQMKKHLAWYTEGLVRATDCRARIFQTKSPGEVWEVFQEYWEGLGPPRGARRRPLVHSPSPCPLSSADSLSPLGRGQGEGRSTSPRVLDRSARRDLRS